MTLITEEELHSILGGCYTGPSYAWSNFSGVVGNFREMLEAGLFDDYTGTGNFYGTYNTSSIGEGFNPISGHRGGSIITFSTGGINFGSLLAFNFGLLTGSETEVSVNHNGIRSSFSYIDGKSTLTFKLPNGTEYSAGYKEMGNEVSFGIKFSPW